MKVQNTNQAILKKLFEEGKTVLYVSLIKYNNNNCMKVYNEDGEPLGDIPQENIDTYIEKEKEVLFINETIDDNTGLPLYTLSTIV